MKNPLAEAGNPDSLDLVTPDTADPDHDYFCPDQNCPDPERKLVLKSSPLDNKYFSHRNSFDHPTDPIVLLHKMAVAHLKLLPSLFLPAIHAGTSPQIFVVDHTLSRIQFEQETDKAPSILLTSVEGRKIYVDFITLHKQPSDKKRSAVDQDISFLTINLSDLSEQFTDAVEDAGTLQKMVSQALHDDKRKSWLYISSEEISKAQKPYSRFVNATALLGSGIALMLILRRFFKR